jgi:hypothetical protein
MTIQQPRYSKEEFARRGQEIYETEVRSQVTVPNLMLNLLSLFHVRCSLLKYD